MKTDLEIAYENEMLPICMAKKPNSLTFDAKVMGLF